MPILTLSIQKSMSVGEKKHFPKWRASSSAKPIANVNISGNSFSSFFRFLSLSSIVKSFHFEPQTLNKDMVGKYSSEDKIRDQLRLSSSIRLGDMA